MSIFILWYFILPLHSILGANSTFYPTAFTGSPSHFSHKRGWIVGSLWRGGKNIDYTFDSIHTVHVYCFEGALCSFEEEILIRRERERDLHWQIFM